MKFHLDCMNSCKYKRDANSAPSFCLLHVNENCFLDKTSNPGFFVFGCCCCFKKWRRGSKKKIPINF